MQTAGDSTKPIILVSTSTDTSMNTGRHEKVVNRKNVRVTETSKTSSCGQERTCQVCLAMLPSRLKNGRLGKEVGVTFPHRGFRTAQSTAVYLTAPGGTVCWDQTRTAPVTKAVQGL